MSDESFDELVRRLEALNEKAQREGLTDAEAEEYVELHNELAGRLSEAIDPLVSAMSDFARNVSEAFEPMAEAVTQIEVSDDE